MKITRRVIGITIYDRNTDSIFDVPQLFKSLKDAKSWVKSSYDNAIIIKTNYHHDYVIVTKDEIFDYVHNKSNE